MSARLDGTVLGRCMRRHRHQEFIRFLNTVEAVLARLSRRRLKRGSFPSLVALQEAINRFLAEHNERSRPFAWTADPDAIVEKVRRGHRALASMEHRAG